MKTLIWFIFNCTIAGSVTASVPYTSVFFVFFVFRINTHKITQNISQRKLFVLLKLALLNPVPIQSWENLGKNCVSKEEELQWCN